MNGFDGPRIPMMEVARKLQTTASRDDATCPELTQKTYSGAADRVWSKDDMTLISHDFVGPRIQMEGQMLHRQIMIVRFARLGKIYD